MIGILFNSSVFNLNNNTARINKIAPKGNTLEVDVTLVPLGYFTFSIRIDKENNGEDFTAWNQLYIPSTSKFYDVVNYIEKASIVIMYVRERTIDDIYTQMIGKTFSFVRATQEVVTEAIDKNVMYDVSLPQTLTRQSDTNKYAYVCNYVCARNRQNNDVKDAYLKVNTISGTVVSELDDTSIFCAFLVIIDGVGYDVRKVNGKTVSTIPALALGMENPTSGFGQLYNTIWNIVEYSDFNPSTEELTIPDMSSYTYLNYINYPCYWKKYSTTKLNIDLSSFAQPDKCIIEILNQSVEIESMAPECQQAISLIQHVVPQGMIVNIYQSYYNSQVMTSKEKVTRLISTMSFNMGIVTDLSALEEFNRNNVNARALAVTIPAQGIDFAKKQAEGDFATAVGSSITSALTSGIMATAITGNPLLGGATAGVSLLTNMISAAWTYQKAMDTADFQKKQLEVAFNLQMNNLANQKQVIKNTSEEFFSILGTTYNPIQIFYQTMSDNMRSMAFRHYELFSYKTNIRTTFKGVLSRSVFIQTANAIYDMPLNDNRMVDISKQLDQGVRFIRE